MILSGSDFTTVQRCPRRWVLEQNWKPLRWHAKTLFDAVLRKAVMSLSLGTPKERVSSEAVTSFREVAADPGLDTLSDPWTLAGDYCATLRTVIEYLSRLTLLVVDPGLTVTLSDGLEWRVLSFRDESGLLHRWTSADSVDDDWLSRELHSWYVFGDIAAAQAPMTLHVVEIGSQRNGRLHSAWCKAFKHPVIANRFRFRRRTGQELKGDWKPVWFADSPDQDAKVWVDLMLEDNLKPIHHIDVKAPSDEHVERWKEQLLPEVQRMEALRSADPFTVLMCRTACDLPYVCPWQPACYAEGTPDIGALGGFRRL